MAGALVLLVLVLFHFMKESKERFNAIGPALQNQQRGVKDASDDVERFAALGPALKDQERRFQMKGPSPLERFKEWASALTSKDNKYKSAAASVERARFARNVDPRENQFMDIIGGTEDQPPIRTDVQAKAVVGTLLN